MSWQATMDGNQKNRTYLANALIVVPSDAVEGLVEGLNGFLSQEKKNCSLTTKQNKNASSQLQDYFWYTNGISCLPTENGIAPYISLALSTGQRNHHGHGVCWVSTCRKKGLM